MAFIETEYAFGPNAGHRSIETRKTLEGYAAYPSHTADRFAYRLSRLMVALTMLLLGVILVMRPELLVTGSGMVEMLIRALGLYIAAFGVHWSVQAMRRAPELSVDLRGRALHLVRLNWRGLETWRHSIRFEEISELRLIDRLPSVDMRGHSKAWDMGRIEVVWHQTRVDEILTGDVSDLELVLARLRRDIGHY
ncbi:MAG: hypothetical protein AAF340_01615 [Pseudomonadota bacterium]